jgi:NAD(P)-dependent dehydrogenase (short-subunit alcohol dehydrogenase family)
MARRVCAVVGVGPGNGAAFAQKFASEGYGVALCSRNQEYLAELEGNIENSRAYEYDATNTSAQHAFERIRGDLGPVSILIYNAGAGQFGSIDDVTVEAFQHAWEVNARGLFLATQAVLPDMRASGSGNIVVIGATASIRGGARFTSFASAKAAQRSLAQSLARHLGPQKIHVSYVVIDGVIGLERARKQMTDAPDEFFLTPEKIAESVYFLTQQDPQAWTFELDLRPFGEKW